MNTISKKLFLILICTGLLYSCNNNVNNKKEVIIYTSVDQPFSEPILKRFQSQTGISVQAIYDVEAAKTTGLVNRLIAEKENPQADVFWNSEILQTIVLQENGVLAPYNSPHREEIPSQFQDSAGYWTGFAARARVFIVNTDLVREPQKINTLNILIDEDWMGSEIGIANPLFGTTATHAAALYAFWGPDKGKEFFENLIDKKLRVLDGNSVVRDLVADGVLAFGLTDTDDACVAINNGYPVVIVFPDQESIGTLVVPGTVSMIKDGPNPEEAKLLIDFLLSAEVEQSLINSGFSHIPLHSNLDMSNSCVSTNNIRILNVDFLDVYEYFDIAQQDLREIFLK